MLSKMPLASEEANYWPDVGTRFVEMDLPVLAAFW